ncbi:hypothetical protein EJ02DRAFT_493710 [Clathrospora elynae]|uniref:Uncharacterized protein n=1 Tax=Clathrospora elynae TaxID=706981 RepID=A0A6A5TCG0_9PLEO|nr:hypothetical protein EJ02DRAFT_493710 [Clathrospora elynae]
MNLNHGSASHRPTARPDAITNEYNEEYLVCFHSDPAGILIATPCYALKPALAARYPRLVEAWEAKKREEREEEWRITQKLTTYAHYFRSEEEELGRRDPGVACDQNLLPGMKQHWGELRNCETHSRERVYGNYQVCKGCRVAHHMQPDRGFDRDLVMARGARVPVCEECATTAVAELGAGYQGCVCDGIWACFRCRETKLGKLANARKDFALDGREGKCGQCVKEGYLVQHVELCLYCRKMNIYAAFGEAS